MNNRPQDYIDRYSEKNYILHDPVVTEFRRNIHPYSWSDIRARRDLKKNEKAIIDEAREWGARDGFMVPIVTRSDRFRVSARVASSRIFRREHARHSRS
jgi:hypothetical protein